MATRYVHAAWCGISALLLATGGHRAFYEALGAIAAPEVAAAALTGLLNLAWYELAYVVGGGLKSAGVFVALPYLGIAAGLAAAVLVRTRFHIHAAAAQLAIGLLVGGLALAVLGWRTVRGFPDPWRLVAILAFLAGHGAWAVQLWRARAERPVPAPAVAP